MRNTQNTEKKNINLLIKKLLNFQWQINQKKEGKTQEKQEIKTQKFQLQKLMHFILLNFELIAFIQEHFIASH